MRLLIILLFSIACNAQVVINAPIKGSELPFPEPTAWWPFNTTAEDSTANNNDGTIEGNPTYVTDAVEGTHSLDLDGTDDGVLINDSGLTTDFFHDDFDSLTVTLWVKVDDASGAARQDLVEEGANGKGFCISIQSGNIAIRIKPQSTTSETITFAYDDDDQWHHIAFVYDLGIARAYMDGVQQGSDLDTGDTEFGDHNDDGGLGKKFNVDAFSTSGAGYYSGLLDDVRYWYDHALTEEQINLIMADL